MQMLSNMSSLFAAFTTLVLSTLFIRAVIGRLTSKQPPQMKGTIPYLSVSIQYMTNAGKFISRVKSVAPCLNEKTTKLKTITNKFVLGLEISWTPLEATLSNFT